MKVYGVIPARFGSSRFPGKPLKMINGQPLLSWVIQATLKSKKIHRVLVATDNEQIQKLAKLEGVEAVMTQSELATGTDRVWSSIEHQDVDIIVNVQGDEPLLEPAHVDALVDCLEKNGDIEMATLGRKMDFESLVSATTAKIILNQKDEAIYFSRFPIPYSREKSTELNGALKHIGLYAYRKSFLKKFCAQAPVAIEIAEGLEQLRALYLGAKIKVVRVEAESWGVDVPEDVLKIEKMMNERGITCPKRKS